MLSNAQASHRQVSSSLIAIAAEVGFPRLNMKAGKRFLMATLAFSPALCSPVPKPLIVSRLNQERKPKSALSRSSLYCPSEARRNTNGTSVARRFFYVQKKSKGLMFLSSSFNFPSSVLFLDRFTLF